MGWLLYFHANLEKSLGNVPRNEKPFLFGFTPEEPPIGLSSMDYHTFKENRLKSTFRDGYNYLLFRCLVKFKYILGYIIKQVQDSKEEYQKTYQDVQRIAKFIWELCAEKIEMPLQFTDPLNKLKDHRLGFNGIGILFEETDIVELYRFTTPALKRIEAANLIYTIKPIPELIYTLEKNGKTIEVDLGPCTKWSYLIKSYARPNGSIVDELQEELLYPQGAKEAVIKEMKWIEDNVGDEIMPFPRILESVERNGPRPKQSIFSRKESTIPIMWVVN